MNISLEDAPNISFEDDHGLLIVYLSGRFDALASEEVSNILNSRIDSGYHRLVIDMSEVDYLSSSGVRVMVL